MTAAVLDRPDTTTRFVLGLQQLNTLDGVVDDGLLAASDGSANDCHLESALSGSSGCPDAYYLH
jgi:hypothetical protein